MNVVLVFSPAARCVREWCVELPENATVQTGLETLQSLLRDQTPSDLPASPGTLTLAVWGRKATLEQPLREGDRLEWLRPLRVDPKLARRERFQQQGARTTGLFAKRRAGGKAGY
jgi:putative ubiquitin-RnfH superfamily antitoxin RatB of RatAB toxin-antitoxin module